MQLKAQKKTVFMVDSASDLDEFLTHHYGRQVHTAADFEMADDASVEINAINEGYYQLDDHDRSEIAAFLAGEFPSSWGFAGTLLKKAVEDGLAEPGIYIVNNP